MAGIARYIGSDVTNDGVAIDNYTRGTIAIEHVCVQSNEVLKALWLGRSEEALNLFNKTISPYIKPEITDSYFNGSFVAYLEKEEVNKVLHDTLTSKTMNMLTKAKVIRDLCFRFFPGFKCIVDLNARPPVAAPKRAAPKAPAQAPTQAPAKVAPKVESGLGLEPRRVKVTTVDAAPKAPAKVTFAPIAPKRSETTFKFDLSEFKEFKETKEAPKAAAAGTGKPVPAPVSLAQEMGYLSLDGDGVDADPTFNFPVDVDAEFDNSRAAAMMPAQLSRLSSDEELAKVLALSMQQQ
ncbi:MAG: hypothetical protein HYX48_00885 [Chlamydiales bacterium]|nr:hypothetical protein [Chlamydiales bacterium]